jgi:hypothetical protein
MEDHDAYCQCRSGRRRGLTTSGSKGIVAVPGTGSGKQVEMDCGADPVALEKSFLQLFEIEF